MAEIELLFSTGDEVADRIMRGYVAAFEAAFPGRLRCFVVAGGYAEGTATPLSDIDGGPVFRAPLSHGEWGRANALIRACGDLARIHFDAGAGAGATLYDWRDTGDVWVSRGAVEQRYDVTLAYRIIWGEEFREPILLPPFEYWIRACFFCPPHHGGAPAYIALTRGHATLGGSDYRPLTYPLTYPDAADPFYGYARHPLTARDGTTHLTTRRLVRTALAGANAMVAWKARRFLASKADAAAAYREHVDGPWGDLVEAVDRTCRVEHRYLVPQEDAARRRLRELCGAMPEFENSILERYREFLLEELAASAAAAADGSPAPAFGGWVPVELAGWLLERSPDDVQALAERGDLASADVAGRRRIAETPCLQRWAAAMLGRVLFPRDREIEGALNALASHETPLVRMAARASLEAMG